MQLPRKALFLTMAATLAIGTVYAVSPEDQLLKLAAQGDNQARLDLAQLYDQRGQHALAIDQLQAAAGAGQASAYSLLAELYLDSAEPSNWPLAIASAAAAAQYDPVASVVTDVGVAASLRALDTTLPEADQIRLGDVAASLLSEAAVQGDQRAKWHLGYLHVVGKLSGRHLEGGVAMIHAAADAGNAVAARWLSHQYDHIARTGRAAPGFVLASYDVQQFATTQSMLYLKQAAAEGNPHARIELAGRFAATGRAEDADRAGLIQAHLDKEPSLDTFDLLKGDLLGSFVGKGAALLASRGAQSLADLLPPSRSDAPGPQVDDHLQQISTLAAERDLAFKRIKQLEAELDQVQVYRERLVDAAQANAKGLAYYTAGDYESALPLFRKASEANHAGAVANLALHYLNGQAVPQNPKQAAKLLERASDLGNLVATENLARLYETGAGVGHNPARAILWYRRAETLGSTEAHAALQRLGDGTRR